MSIFPHKLLLNNEEDEDRDKEENEEDLLDDSLLKLDEVIKKAAPQVEEGED